MPTPSSENNIALLIAVVCHMLERGESGKPLARAPIDGSKSIVVTNSRPRLYWTAGSVVRVQEHRPRWYVFQPPPPREPMGGWDGLSRVLPERRCPPRPVTEADLRLHKPRALAAPSRYPMRSLPAADRPRTPSMSGTRPRRSSTTSNWRRRLPDRNRAALAPCITA